MNFSKKRRPGSKTIRKSNKQHLQYIARNLRYIDQGWDMMSEAQVMTVFKEANSYRNQLVVREVYRQQRELLHKRGKKNEQSRIPDRIVSFHEPWVRPIVRGKVGRKTEFGAKVNSSETEGFIRAEFFLTTKAQRMQIPRKALFYRLIRKYSIKIFDCVTQETLSKKIRLPGRDQFQYMSPLREPFCYENERKIQDRRRRKNIPQA